MKREAFSLALRMAKARQTGVCGISPPRMLNAQAIESGKVQHGRVGLGLADMFGKLGELGAGMDAGMLHLVDGDRCARR